MKSFARLAVADNLRTEERQKVGRMACGKIAPVMGTFVEQGEGGALHQEITFKLDPIPGEMRTGIYAEIHNVWVPVQATHALKNDTDEYAHVAEIIRDKLVSDTPLFALEAETEISKRMEIVPIKVGGSTYVTEEARLAYIAAVNYLRQRIFVDAELLPKTETGVTPALLGSTALQRMRGVLDPEDRVDGYVDFEGEINIRGIGIQNNKLGDNIDSSGYLFHEGDGGARHYDYNKFAAVAGAGVGIEVDDTGRPQVKGDMTTGHGLSLTDYFQAKYMDKLTREMRAMLDKNPEMGEEMIARMAFGLQMETDNVPVLLSKKTVRLNQDWRFGFDGDGLDKSQTRVMDTVRMHVPVPRTELGGVVVTLVTVKPDESLARVPHPFFTRARGGINFLADAMEMDPQPVSEREVYADCDTADEENVVMHVGYNRRFRQYRDVGYSAALDTSTVEADTAFWQYQIPTSVTPTNVIYDEDFDQPVFADNSPGVQPVTYIVSSMVRMATPIPFGPDPVEDMPIIDDADLFEEEES
ncbi:hypothetical protein [Maritimibacter alexandrii]|uniref:hypothetical protein n=1 Tax=Maritimibacter alexandrii TaxID=2570355 RepID=UPI001107C9A3|nr:hypothetical protein [Maritimibacter alexandrii]